MVKTLLAACLISASLFGQEAAPTSPNTTDPDPKKFVELLDKEIPEYQARILRLEKLRVDLRSALKENEDNPSRANDIIILRIIKAIQIELDRLGNSNASQRYSPAPSDEIL